MLLDSCDQDVGGSSSQISVNLHVVRQKIAEAAIATGRSSNEITLIAASKTVEPERLQTAMDLGQHAFGENRVQEAKEKWPNLIEKNAKVTLHLVGPLQSNKVRDAVRLFHVIQSVDRSSLAKALAKESEKQGRSPTIFIQVNTSSEPQKSGVCPEAAPDLIRACRDVYGLKLAGLMCIPPVNQNPSADFELLKRMAKDEGVTALSMGMSADYEQAILCGATHVRVGSAIFGTRPLRKDDDGKGVDEPLFSKRNSGSTSLRAPDPDFGRNRDVSSR